MLQQFFFYYCFWTSLLIASFEVFVHFMSQFLDVQWIKKMDKAIDMITFLKQFKCFWIMHPYNFMKTEHKISLIIEPLNI